MSIKTLQTNHKCKYTTIEHMEKIWQTHHMWKKYDKHITKHPYIVWNLSYYKMQEHPRTTKYRPKEIHTENYFHSQGELCKWK